jgi:hypothetical protein
MLVIKTIGNRNELLVKPLRAPFLPADQQDRHSSRVESVEDPDRLSAALNPQLSHGAVFRCSYTARVRERQHRAAALELPHMRIHIDLLRLREVRPPLAELVGVFDLPCHQSELSLYSFYGI